MSRAKKNYPAIPGGLKSTVNFKEKTAVHFFDTCRLCRPATSGIFCRRESFSCQNMLIFFKKEELCRYISPPGRLFRQGRRAAPRPAGRPGKKRGAPARPKLPSGGNSRRREGGCPHDVPVAAARKAARPGRVSPLASFRILPVEPQFGISSGNSVASQETKPSAAARKRPASCGARRRSQRNQGCARPDKREQASNS